MGIYTKIFKSDVKSIEKKFNFPLNIVTLFFSDILSAISAITLWVIYFIK